MMKTKLVITLLAVAMLTTLAPSVFAASLSYPSPGEIGGGTGGALWNAWDPKEDAVPYFMNLANNYGGSYESIGESSGDKGWDIILFKFGNPNGGAIMVDAYLHGNEFYGYQVLKSVMTWLVTSNDADAQRILQNNYVLVVPMANYRWARTNYNIPSWITANDPGNDGDDCGVNLNRNFYPSYPSSASRTNGDGYSGVSADSEAESQALINAWNKYNPRIYWNLHQGIGPSTMCTAVSSQAHDDASEVRSLLPSIQRSVGVSNGWSFSVSSRYGNGYSKDGAAYRGSAGFLTEVMSGWDASSSKKADLESGNTFKQVKAMFIAMCRAVEGASSSPVSGSDQSSDETQTESTTNTWSKSSSTTTSSDSDQSSDDTQKESTTDTWYRYRSPSTSDSSSSQSSDDSETDSTADPQYSSTSTSSDTGSDQSSVDSKTVIEKNPLDKSSSTTTSSDSNTDQSSDETQTESTTDTWYRYRRSSYLRYRYWRRSYYYYRYGR